MAKQVVQVAGKARALVGHGEPRHLGAGLDQLAVGAHDLAHCDHGRADAQQAEHEAPDGARLGAAHAARGPGHGGRGRDGHDVPRARQADGTQGAT